jgi:hypothetical protein
MDDSNIQINTSKLQRSTEFPLAFSFDPEATTRTQIDIKVKTKKDDDAESLRDSDLEDMMNSSVDSEEETPVDLP